MIKKYRRLAAVLLSIVMIASLTPATVYADQNNLSYDLFDVGEIETVESDSYQHSDSVEMGFSQAKDEGIEKSDIADALPDSEPQLVDKDLAIEETNDTDAIENEQTDVFEEEQVGEEETSRNEYNTEEFLSLEALDAWYSINGNTVILSADSILTNEDEKYLVNLGSASLREIDKAGFTLRIIADSDLFLESGQKVSLSLPEQLLFDDVNRLNYPYAVLDSEEKELTFTLADSRAVTAGDVIWEVPLSFGVKLEQFMSGADNLFSIVTGSTELFVQFGPYNVPRTIDQFARVDILEDEHVVVFHNTIGEEQQDIPVEGFTLQSSFDNSLFTVVKLESEQGAISYEELEEGIVFEVPEESLTPWSYDLVLKPVEEIQDADGIQVSNKAELQHNSLVSPADGKWSDTCEIVFQPSEKILTPSEYLKHRLEDYDLSQMSDSEQKELCLAIYQEYKDYIIEYQQKLQGSAADGGMDFYSDTLRDVNAGGRFSNEYLDVSVDFDGKFTIGTVEGDPSYSSDNNQNLLFGHPSPWSSETIIVINGEEYEFVADNVSVGNGSAHAVMHIAKQNIIVYEDLMLVSSGTTSHNDCVKITYEVVNNNTSAVNASVRIMLDTMIASNDDAPFKVPGTGNLTTIKTYTGSNIPSYYQVYDNLDNPSTLATGYLITAGERKPDKVQFTNWGEIKDSSWSYTPSEGSGLGDSAVGIYFSNMNVAGRKSVAVSTRYGVGLGTGSSGASNASHVVSSSDVAFKILDNTTRRPIIKATVDTNNDCSGVTDADGIVVLPLSKVKDREIKVEANNYATAYENGTWSGGSTYTIFLKGQYDTTPKITTVTMDGKDLLNQTVKFTEDSSSVISKPKNKNKVYNIRINAATDTPNCVYYLMQEEKLVKKSNDGSFQLKAMPGSFGDEPYIEGLQAGNRVYIKCVAPNGQKSTRRIGLEVYSPRLSFKTGNLTKAGVSLFSGGSGDTGNLLLKVLCGAGDDDNHKFKASGINGKVSLNVDPDTQTIKIGINVKPDLLTDKKEEAFRDYANGLYYIAKSNLSPEEWEEYYKSKIKKWQLEDNKYRIASFESGFFFSGVAELSYKDGHFNGTLSLVAGFEMSGKKTFHFMVWVVPMYLEVGANGKWEIKIGGDIVCEDGESFLSALRKMIDELSFEVGAYGEIGAGRDVIGKVGGRLSAKIKHSCKFKTGHEKLTVSGKLSLEAKLLLWEKSFKIAEGTWTVFDNYINSGTYASPSQENEVQTWDEAYELLMEQPTVMAGREYMDATDNSIESSVVMSNAYTEAAPKLINANGKKYLFWLEDIYDREPQNRTALVYSVDGENNYTIVEDDGTADFAYDLSVASDGIYVIWQDCKEVYGSNVDMETMCKGVDVSLAKISTSDDQVKTTWNAIANNNKTNMLPAVFTDNSKVYVAWNSINGNLFDTIYNSRLHYATLQSGSLGNVTTVAPADERIVERLTLEKINGAATVVYTLVDWSDLLNQTTQDTFYLRIGNTSSAQGVTLSGETVPQHAMLDRTLYAFVYRDGNIYYMTATGGSEMAVFTEEETPNDLSSNFIVVNAEDSDLLIWVNAPTDEMNDGNVIRKACAVSYANGIWSEPFVLTELSDGTISSLNAVFDNNGDLVLSWQSIVYEDDELISSDLMQKTVDYSNGYSDVVLTDYSYDETLALEGEGFNVDLSFKNGGSNTIDTVYVDVTSSETEERFEFNNLNLKPGESLSKSVVFPLPTNEVDSYEISVYCDDDFDMENGKATMRLGGTLIEAYRHGTVMVNDVQMVRIEAKNECRIPAENVWLRLFADSEDGTVVYEKRIGTLEGGESVFLNVPAQVLEELPFAFMTLTTSTELLRENTTQQISYSTDTVQIANEYSLQVDSGAGGSLVGQYNGDYEEGIKTTIEAKADSGYTFWSWVCDEEQELFDDPYSERTSFLMPSHDTAVRAEFRPTKSAESVLLSDTALTMKTGESTSLTAYVAPSDASEHAVFSSSDEKIITVDRDGVVYAVSSGVATITVKAGNSTAVCSVTVEDVLLAGIDLIGPVYLGSIGMTEDLMPVLTPENASEKIIWSSDNESVVTVNDKGVVCAVSEGDACVTATSASNPSVTASVMIHVKLEVSSIRVDVNRLLLDIGSEETLGLSLEPAGSRLASPAIWEVDDPNILEISPLGQNAETAKIKGLRSGITIVTARYLDKTTTCTVTVRRTIESISFDESSITVYPNQYYDVSYTVSPSDAEEKIIWTSSNDSVASVTDGEIYAKKTGKATIRATSESGRVSATCTVNVLSRDKTVSKISELQSAHYPYGNRMDNNWYYTHANSPNGIEVTFSKDTCVENGYDYIYIYSGSGTLIGSYTGSSLAGKTVCIPTPKVRIRLYSDSSVSDYYGFAVTSVKAHTHSYSGWTVSRQATAIEEGVEKRNCNACGHTLTRKTAKLKPTIKLNVKGTVPLQIKQSSKKVKVSGLAIGDSIKSVKSSKPKVVKVSVSGNTIKLLAQKKTGTAKITITLHSGKKKTFKVKVQKGVVKTKKISVSSKKIELKKGKKRSIKAQATPLTTQQNITYSTSNKSIVTVNKKGVIKAKKKGKAIITVKSGKKKVRINVIVK